MLRHALVAVPACGLPQTSAPIMRRFQSCRQQHTSTHTCCWRPRTPLTQWHLPPISCHTQQLPSTASSADATLQPASEQAHISTQSVSKPAKKQKRRLDAACLELHPHLSRNVIQSWILQGKVFVDGKVVSKAGAQVTADCRIVMPTEEPKYVCRAGHKLEKALQYFNVDVTGMTCLDSGQSTGGFTDCLLQNGAAHVYGIDVGYGQVADRIRRDPRVTVIERFNLRHLQPEDLPTQVDVATLDLAFISVLKVVPAVVRVLKPAPAGQLLVLIKPQFEAGKGQVSHGGVVRDRAVHQQVIQRVTEGISELGFVCKGVTESPIKGDKSGNTEFLAHFVRDPSRSADTSLGQRVEAAAAAAAEGEAVPEPFL